MKTMLYSHPGPHKIHGNDFEYLVVDDEQVGEALKKGWARTTPEALAKAEAAKKKPKAKGK